MNKILFSILGAFMVSTMASAQYLNVKLKDGTYHSYKTSSDMEVSFGDKKGTDPTVSTQSVTVNGHTVAVKLADDTPASEVMLSIYVERDTVKIGAYSKLNHGLWCSMDDNGEVLETSASNGVFTFTLSNLSKDVVVTLGYINVSFDLNNSGMDAKFTAKPNDITKIGYNDNAYIKEPDRPFSDKYGFRGWYMDKECTKAWNFSTDKVTKSMTLYAKWKEDPAGNKINEHEFVKLGGYYWAIENVRSDGYNRVGHLDTYGDYFNQCYGSTSDFNATDNNALNAAKSWESEGNYSWTLPSAAQWQALIDYCNWTWTTDYEYNGTTMNGMLVTGRDDTFESGNSVFLPAAGGCYGGGNVVSQGNDGYYWSSTPDGSYGAYYLNFDSGSQYVDNSGRYLGYSVRAVLNENE